MPLGKCVKIVSRGSGEQLSQKLDALPTNCHNYHTHTHAQQQTGETTRVPALLSCCGSLRMVIKPHLIIRIMDDLKITAECQRQQQRQLQGVGGKPANAGKANNVQHGTRHTFNFLKTHKTWLSWLNCKSKTCFKDYFCATHTHTHTDTLTRTHTQTHAHNKKSYQATHGLRAETAKAQWEADLCTYIYTYVSDICTHCGYK